MAEITRVTVPHCVPAPLRRTLEDLANNDKKMADSSPADPLDITAARTPFADTAGNAGNLNGQPASYYTNIANLTGGPPSASVMAAIYTEQTLTGDLASGATQTVSGFVLNGKMIRSGRKLTSGTLVGAFWNGTDFTILAANKCDVAA